MCNAPHLSHLCCLHAILKSITSSYQKFHTWAALRCLVRWEITSSSARQCWRDLCAERVLKLPLSHQSDPYLGRFSRSQTSLDSRGLVKNKSPVTTRPVCFSGSESVCVPQVTAELLIFMLAKLQAGRLIRWYVFSLGLWGQVELPH